VCTIGVLLVESLVGAAFAQAPSTPPGAAPTPGQSATAAAPSFAGEIRGTVKSGSAPLPGVSITASNTLTGKKVVTSTDAQGNYSLQLNSRGRYVIKADFPAFAVATKEAVINATTPKAQVDLELVLLSRVPKTTTTTGEGSELAQAVTGILSGQASQSLSLTGTGAAASANLSAEMPDNTPALANSADASNEAVSITGSNGRTQDFGRDIEDIRDRIEEMRARGDFGPPGGGPAGGNQMFGGGPGGGFGGPGVLVLGGPGGSGGGRGMRNFNINRPHGNLFFSTGNSAFDAAPYSLSGAPSPKPSFSSYRFGGTIGGPLPKKIDSGQKTFFYLNAFSNRSTVPYQMFSHVPTGLERQGDFSQTLLANGQPVQLLDPTTGQITDKLSAINPTSQALLQFIPLPNQPGQQNFRFTDSAENNSTTIGFRLMRTIGSGGGSGPRRGPFGRNNINIGFNYNSSSNTVLNPFPSIQGATTFQGFNGNIGYTYSRGRWTNNLRASYNLSRNNTTNLFAGVTNIEAQLGINGVSTNPADWGLPGLSFSGFTGLKDVNPVHRDDGTFQVNDNLIWRHGKHNFRFGGDYRRLDTNLRSDPNPRGTFTFTGLATSINGAPGTGYDFADFLLGIAQQTAIQYSPNQFNFAANAWDLYVNDDWRVGTNLTLNLGLRYEYAGPYTEANNRLVNLAPNADFTAVAPVQPGQASPFNNFVYPSSLVEPDRNNWAPRIGIAWKPMSNTVVRAGYGINYNLGQYRGIVQQLALQPPFSVTQTNILSSAVPLTIQNGFPTNANVLTNNYGVDPNYRLAYVQVWNLNVQREFKGNIVLNVGYTGTKGTSLDIVTAPNRGPNGLLIPNVQAFQFETSQGDSILHAGTLRVRKRFAHGIAFGGTYTFSKSIDDASSIGGGATVVAQNPNDLAAERGLSSFDQRQRFSGDWTFELPFGEGRKWLTHAGPWEKMFGAWQWTGSVNLATGTPFTVRVLGNFNDVARGTNGTLRADLTGEPFSVADPTVQGWFNTAAFTLPLPGQFGNSGRNILIGPTTLVFNMSMSKSFQLKDNMGVEVRADATNVFNTPQFTSIDTTVNSPTYGQVIGVGAQRQMTLGVRYRF
jgi:hypothetical protein